MSWGIAETAPEIEKIKAESADYLNGLNSCCAIDYDDYSYAFDFYNELLDKAYLQGKKDAEPQIIACGEGEITDMSNYSDTLWRLAYERGKKDGKRKTGTWVSGRCDKCGEHAPYWSMSSTYHCSNFCPNCGADMRKVEHEIHSNI